MKRLIKLTVSAAKKLDDLGAAVLPTLARVVFAGVLANYFWTSALTKIGPGAFGFLSPPTGAYAQIFPRVFEAVGYDASQLGVFHWAVVVAGTWAEFILPALILVGLFARLASFGAIGFIAVMSLTDIYGHGVSGADLGTWFDVASGALIADQRALWVMLLLVVIFHGAGPLSADHYLARRLPT